MLEKPPHVHSLTSVSDPFPRHSARSFETSAVHVVVDLCMRPPERHMSLPRVLPITRYDPSAALRFTNVARRHQSVARCRKSVAHRQLTSARCIPDVTRWHLSATVPAISHGARCGALRICGFHLLIKLFVARAAKHAYSNDCFVGSCRGFVMPAFSHTGVPCDRRHEDNLQFADGELYGQAPCLKPHEGVNNG